MTERTRNKDRKKERKGDSNKQISGQQKKFKRKDER